MILQELRGAAKKIPGLRPLVIRARVAIKNLRPRHLIFRGIYERNEWGGAESVSGPGSDEAATRLIREQLPELWRRHGVRHLVDAPCGDFLWMRHIVDHLDSYTGVDIVAPLIAQNTAAYGSERIRFLAGDLIHGPVPGADMILCRDGLVHLSFRHVRAALENMKRSGSRYLLTTTFPAWEQNVDIPTGSWRPLNLERPPFRFPPPIDAIVEGCKEGNGKYADKSLALWRLADL